MRQPKRLLHLHNIPGRQYGARVGLVRPHPEAFMRMTPRQSSGSTLYFAASTHHAVLQLARLLGVLCAARSWASCEKSFGDLVKAPTARYPGSNPSRLGSHGTKDGPEAIQPSW